MISFKSSFKLDLNSLNPYVRDQFTKEFVQNYNDTLAVRRNADSFERCTNIPGNNDSRERLILTGSDRVFYESLLKTLKNKEKKGTDPGILNNILSFTMRDLYGIYTTYNKAKSQAS
jgi:hypothetical protein